MVRASASSTTMRESCPQCQPHPPKETFLQNQLPSQHALCWKLGVFLLMGPPEKLPLTHSHSPALGVDCKQPPSAFILSSRKTSRQSSPGLIHCDPLALHSLQGPKHPQSRRCKTPQSLSYLVDYFCFGKVANKIAAYVYLCIKRKGK